MWWSALLPKIKTRWPSLRDPGNIHHPHFLRTLGGIFTSSCAQLRPVGTATSLGSVDVRRLPTRSAAPVSLDRPPLSPRVSARWTQCDDHLLRDHVRERWRSRRATAADAPHTFWPCSGVASLVKMVKERHLQCFWPLLFDFFLKREGSLGPIVSFHKKD